MWKISKFLRDNGSSVFAFEVAKEEKNENFQCVCLIFLKFWTQKLTNWKYLISITWLGNKLVFLEER